MSPAVEQVSSECAKAKSDQAVLKAFKDLDTAIHDLRCMATIVETLREEALESATAKRKGDYIVFDLTEDQVESLAFMTIRMVTQAKQLARDYERCFYAGDAA